LSTSLKKKEDTSPQIPSYLNEASNESLIKQYEELIGVYNANLSKITAKEIAVIHFKKEIKFQ